MLPSRRLSLYDVTAEEARALLDSIGAPANGLTSEDHPPTVNDLRDRALIGVMVYPFARVNAVIGMMVSYYFIQGGRGWVRLHERGGKEHEVPCHHTLEKLLDDYLAADPSG